MGCAAQGGSVDDRLEFSIWPHLETLPSFFTRWKNWPALPRTWCLWSSRLKAASWRTASHIVQGRRVGWWTAEARPYTHTSEPSARHPNPPQFTSNFHLWQSGTPAQCTLPTIGAALLSSLGESATMDGFTVQRPKNPMILEEPGMIRIFLLNEELKNHRILKITG